MLTILAKLSIKIQIKVSVYLLRQEQKNVPVFSQEHQIHQVGVGTNRIFVLSIPEWDTNPQKSEKQFMHESFSQVHIFLFNPLPKRGFREIF